MLFYGVVPGETLHCLSFAFFRFRHQHLDDTGKNGTEVGADKHQAMEVVLLESFDEVTQAQTWGTVLTPY